MTFAHQLPNLCIGGEMNLCATLHPVKAFSCITLFEKMPHKKQLSHGTETSIVF